MFSIFKKMYQDSHKPLTFIIFFGFFYILFNFWFGFRSNLELSNIFLVFGGYIFGYLIAHFAMAVFKSKNTQ